MCSAFIARYTRIGGCVALLMFLLSACFAPATPNDTAVLPTDVATTTPSEPATAPTEPTTTAAVRYFWPALIPEGLVVQPATSMVDERSFTLELIDPDNAQRTLRLRSAPELPPPPATGSTAISVRGQQGVAFTTGAGFLIHWQEHGQPYTIAGFFGPEELVAIAESLEPMIQADWQARLSASASVAPQTAASCNYDSSVASPVMLGTPFCVVWRDDFADEQGFRIALSYLGDPAETFQYEVGPNVTHYIVPESDTPYIPTEDACIRRGSYIITIEALFPNGPVNVGSVGHDSVCAQSTAPDPTEAPATDQPVHTTIDPQFAALHAELAALVDGWQGLHAVSVTDLQTGQTISVHGDRPQLAACTIKIVLLMAVAQDIEAGRYTADDVAELVQSAMGPSNTWPARELLGQIGGGDIGAGVHRVNALLDELGATGSILTHPPGYPAEEYGYMEQLGIDENRVTTDDLNLILAKLYRGDALSPWATEYVLDSMTIAPDWMDQPLRSSIDPAARLYHKIGQLYEPEHVWNDAAIVEFERDGQRHAYAISYLGSYGASWQEAYSHEAELGAIVWGYFSVTADA